MGRKATKRKGASSPPLLQNHGSKKALRQRPEPPSPSPSTFTDTDTDSIPYSSNSSTSTSSSTYALSTTSQPPTTKPTSNPGQRASSMPPTTITPPSVPTQTAPTNVHPPPTKTTQIRPPPIILSSSEWRKIAPSIYLLPNLNPVCLTAKSSNGQILLQSSDISHFRLIQKALIEKKTQFHTFSLPEERSLKVVLKGIPNDLTPAEIKTELKALNYQVTYVRRFGTPEKPMPLCLVHLTADTNSKDIYLLNNLFYVQISVEPLKSSGPAQCFSCQRFGHGSRNCGHPLRCVKCAENHSAKDCPKTREQSPTCCNCNGPHTANFRGCPVYLQQKDSKTPSPTPKPVHPPTQNPALPNDQQQLTPPPPPTLITAQPSKSYSTATIGSTPPPRLSTPPTINLALILKLLTNLLTAISTNQDPVSLIESTIKTFLTILSSQNG